MSDFGIRLVNINPLNAEGFRVAIAGLTVKAFDPPDVNNRNKTPQPGQPKFNQVVEVQTPEPTSPLSLLALGTLGLGTTLKRHLTEKVDSE